MPILDGLLLQIKYKPFPPMSHMNVRRRPLTIFFYVFQFLILSYDIHATMCIP